MGVTLDKRRGLYVVLTPRFSTEKQPLSSTCCGGHHGRRLRRSRGTHVDGGWKERRRSQHPPDFRLLNTHHHPPLVPPPLTRSPHPACVRIRPPPCGHSYFFLHNASLLERSRTRLSPSTLSHLPDFSLRNDARQRLRGDQVRATMTTTTTTMTMTMRMTMTTSTSTRTIITTMKARSTSERYAREGREPRNGAFLSGNG